MDDTSLREQLRQSEQRNEALSRESEALRASQQRTLDDFAALRHDHAALVDATQIIVKERDALRQRAVLCGPVVVGGLARGYALRAGRDFFQPCPQFPR